MNATSPDHPIAEFLYQLTKMLTDDNSEIIEWVDRQLLPHAFSRYLLDESRSVLTKQTLEHCRQQIRDLERRMLAKAP